MNSMRFFTNPLPPLSPLRVNMQVHYITAIEQMHVCHSFAWHVGLAVDSGICRLLQRSDYVMLLGQSIEDDNRSRSGHKCLILMTG